MTMLFTAFGPAVSIGAEGYDQVASANEQARAMEVGKYGMLPIYGFDVKDGVYSIEVESSSSMFRVVEAELTVKNGEMEAALTLSGKGYLKLFLGTGEEAAASDEESYIGFTENAEGMYTYTVPVEALDKGIPCAAFSKRKQKWYDRVILFDASTLPEDALLVELPDYHAIEKALKAHARAKAAAKKEAEIQKETEIQKEAEVQKEKQPQAEPVKLDMEDGEYSIEVECLGGSGKAGIASPALLKVQDGKAYARVEWSSSNYDYMVVGSEKYLNENTDGGNSVFEIPIGVMDEEMPVIADTTAMGTPHEVDYTFTFYAESIGSKSQMPREAAKRVVAIAAVIIVGGGILNHMVNKKKRC